MSGAAVSGAGRVSCKTRQSLALGQFGDGGEITRLEHPLPAECARQRFDQSAICPARMRGALGNCISLRPPRSTTRNGIVERHHGVGNGARGSCRFSNVSDQHLACETAEPVDAQPDVSPIRADIHPLDQQRHDARLLGREEFVPQRVKPMQASRTSASEMSLSRVRAAFQVSRHDLWLSEHRAELAEDGRLDLPCGHATDRAGALPNRNTDWLT